MLSKNNQVFVSCGALIFKYHLRAYTVPLLFKLSVKFINDAFKVRVKLSLCFN
jgi:hypothetical protein